MKLLNKKHLKLFKKTREGNLFIDCLLSQIIDEFQIINGKIENVVIKERPLLNLDDIEEHVAKQLKREIK